MSGQAAGRNETITDLLAQLVSFPTESRSSNTELLNAYADRATAVGGTAQEIPGVGGDNQRSNLYVRFGPETPGGLLLSGHTDVVPAGTGWSTDPYQLTNIDGRLYGRGTADMKGFLAVVLAVLDGIDVADMRRPVHLGLSYDEEIGCVGVPELLTVLDGMDHCRPEVIVIGEPTQLQLCTAHSGKRVFEVTITAPSGHSSRSPQQPTAIEAAAAIVSAVADVNAKPGGSDGSFSSNVGTIEGGVAVNVLSPRCELDFECRHQVGFAPDDLLKSVFETIDGWRERLQQVGGDIVSRQVVTYPPLSTASDDPAVVKLRSALGGPDLGQVGFGCEAGLYAKTLPAPAVIYGPGNIADAHRPDEFVVADDLERTAERLRSAIDVFCFDNSREPVNHE